MIKERILTVETIGEPNIDKLPKDIKMVFFQTLLDEVIEYYKNENQDTAIKSTKQEEY